MWSQVRYIWGCSTLQDWIFQLHLFFTFFPSAVSHLFFSHLMTLHLQYLAQSLWRWYDIMITFSLKSPQMLSRDQQEYRQRRDGAHKHNPNSLKLQLMNLLQALYEAVGLRWGCIRAYTHLHKSIHLFPSTHSLKAPLITPAVMLCALVCSVAEQLRRTGWFSRSLWVQACRWTQMSSMLLFCFFNRSTFGEACCLVSNAAKGCKWTGGPVHEYETDCIINGKINVHSKCVQFLQERVRLKRCPSSFVFGADIQIKTGSSCGHQLMLLCVCFSVFPLSYN